MSDHEPGDPRIVEQRFVTVGKRRPDFLDLRRPIPVGSRRNGASASRETDQHYSTTMLLACELTDVDQPLFLLGRRASIADVGTMRPYRDLSGAAAPIEVCYQIVESHPHMLLAQIPCLCLRAVHRRVDALGVPYDPRVLQRIKILFLCFPSGALRLSHSAALLQFHHARDGGVATRSADAAKNAVAPRIVAEVIEAGVLRAGAIGGLRVDHLEVSKHGLPRSTEAVEIQTVKANLRSAFGKLIVVGAQPLDEFDYRGVTPHPRGKAPQTGERFYCVGIALLAAHVVIYAIGAGPIRLRGNSCKPLLLNEPLGDPGALPVKLVGAVRRRPEQNQASIADEIHEQIVVASGAVQRV